MSAAATVAASAIAVFGVLATDHGRTDDAGVNPAGKVESCRAIMLDYEREVRLDPALQVILVAPDAAGISAVEADPDARRCGISVATIKAIR